MKILYFSAIFAFLLPTSFSQDRTFVFRWIYVSSNLLVDENVKKVQDIMQRAKQAGYNGIVLADYKFQILDRMNEKYFQNVSIIRSTAEKLGLDIYPAVCPIGYSNGLISHNVNLAEGIPVRDALFVAKNGKADLVPDPETGLVNGNFEIARNNRFSGWLFQDGIGVSSFADASVRHSGSYSLRMENINIADSVHGNCRIMQTAKVAPYRQYHISVWVKTENFEAPYNARVAVLTVEGRPLCYPELEIKKTQDWTQHHIVFNSLNNSEVRVYFGVWQGKSGRIWWDDAELEEIGLMNVLRRQGCPLIVKSEDGFLYQEGTDFEKVYDSRLGMVPYAGEYETYHKPVSINLTPESRIRDGQRLRVSFYHAMIIYRGQVTCCLSEPEVYSLLKDQISRVNKLFRPKGFFMNHDEIRVVNFCHLCQSRGLTPGQLLADNVSCCIGMIREINPDARIFVWSDMFDPYHNARDNYYLANGTMADSWKGLSTDVVIVNWNYGVRKQSMQWFAEKSFNQIIAGYYDGSVEQIHLWLDDARNIKGIVGVMYTTWKNNYADLESFSKYLQMPQ